MMQLYPAHAAEALEFNKICLLLKQKCRTDAARERVENLRFHTKLEYVEQALLQTDEFKSVLKGSDYFPRAETIGSTQCRAKRRTADRFSTIGNHHSRHTTLG